MSIDTVWILFCTILVLFMQAGFLCLESGLTRQKNSISIAFNKIMDRAICILLYLIIGHWIIYGPSFNGLFGTPPFSKDYFAIPISVRNLFALAFFCTSPTIISGAIAERVRLNKYLLIVILNCFLFYPVVAHWIWKTSQNPSETSGWLRTLGFYDFAGATVVHSVAGWISLASIILLGERKGRFSKSSMPSSSNLPLAMLGMIILFIGWIGFNAGCLIEFNEKMVIKVVMNTLVSGSSGILILYIYCLIRKKTPAIEEMALGFLSGLVAITGSCNIVEPLHAVYIGSIGSLIAYFILQIFFRFKLDDAVYAIPAHLGAGVWGTLAVALFGNLKSVGIQRHWFDQFVIQLEGILTVGIWCFGVTFIFLKIINKISPLRITPEEENVGLNYAEHKATSELTDLLSGMEEHAASQNFDKPIDEEPFTVTGQIAKHYNHVISVVRQSKLNEKEQREELQKSNEELNQIKQILQNRNENLEKEVNAQALKLFQTETLALIGRHSSEIVHNLRNPLSSILLCASKFQLGERDFVKYGSLMTKAASQLKEIIESLLSSTRGVHIDKLQEVDINLIISSDLSLRNLDRDFNTHYKVILDLSDIPKIKGVPIHFSQVIANLINNAIESMKESPKKILEIRSWKESEENRIGFSISDSGHGMNQEVQERIFEPLFTTKNSKTLGEHYGTGFGLAFCLRMITSYHGIIHVQSEEKVGTTFTVFIPIC